MNHSKAAWIIKIDLSPRHCAGVSGPGGSNGVNAQHKSCADCAQKMVTRSGMSGFYWQNRALLTQIVLTECANYGCCVSVFWWNRAQFVQNIQKAQMVPLFFNSVVGHIILGTLKQNGIPPRPSFAFDWSFNLMKCKLGVECALSSNLPFLCILRLISFEIKPFVYSLGNPNCTNAGTQEQSQKDESPTQGKEVLPVITINEFPQSNIDFLPISGHSREWSKRGQEAGGPLAKAKGTQCPQANTRCNPPPPSSSCILRSKVSYPTTHNHRRWKKGTKRRAWRLSRRRNLVPSDEGFFVMWRRLNPRTRHKAWMLSSQQQQQQMEMKNSTKAKSHKLRRQRRRRAQCHLLPLLEGWQGGPREGSRRSRRAVIWQLRAPLKSKWKKKRRRRRRRRRIMIEETCTEEKKHHDPSSAQDQMIIWRPRV